MAARKIQINFIALIHKQSVVSLNVRNNDKVFTLESIWSDLS